MNYLWSCGETAVLMHVDGYVVVLSLSFACCTHHRQTHAGCFQSLNSAAQTEIETVALNICLHSLLIQVYNDKTKCLSCGKNCRSSSALLCYSSSFCFIIIVCDVFCYGTNCKCQQAYSAVADHNIYFRNWIIINPWLSRST